MRFLSVVDGFSIVAKMGHKKGNECRGYGANKIGEEADCFATKQCEVSL
jgi:hypothetical protein